MGVMLLVMAGSLAFLLLARVVVTAMMRISEVVQNGANPGRS